MSVARTAKTRTALHRGMKTVRGRGTAIPRKKRAKLAPRDEDNLASRRWGEREPTLSARRRETVR